MEKNLQYRRTHKAIVQAFLTLSEQLSFDEMTVQHILDEALVSRYTFYKHFRDKYEIAENLQNTLLEDFRQLTEQINQDHLIAPVETEEVNRLFFSFTQRHKHIFRALWNIHTDTIDLRSAFYPVFRQRYLLDPNTDHASASLTLEADICANIQIVLMNYFAQETNLEVDSLGDLIRQAMLNSHIHVAQLKSVDKFREDIKRFY